MMNYSQYYKNIVWTNHALQRLKERRMSQYQAWQTFQYPETTNVGKNNSKIFKRTFGELTLTVIANQNSKREWIVISCWIDPPLPGSIDIQRKKAYLKYKNSSTIGKLWLNLKKIITG